MSQSIALAEKFQPILDEIYKVSSVTSRLDSMTKPIDNGGVAQVSIFKTEIVGMGDYSRSGGYPKGQIVGTWETVTLTAERGREFNIDRMDDEESLGMAFGTLAGEFIRTAVAPEVDAYRFYKYASASGIQSATPATLSSTTVLAAIDAAKQALDDEEVPVEGRILFVSSSVQHMIEAAVTRMYGTGGSVDRRVPSLDGIEIVPVPQGRFYTEITLDAGSAVDAGGYSKTTLTGKDLNFMLLHPSARDQATKLAQLKIFDPDTNQDGDYWKVQYRLYHDAWVYDNKVKGIYIHNKA